MTESYDLLKKRLVELANKSYNSDIFTFTQFLGLAEQSAFSEIKKEIRGIPYTSFGGAKGEVLFQKNAHDVRADGCQISHGAPLCS